METIYTCLIVDDEKPAHWVLKSHIDKCKELVYSASVYNGKKAIELISQQSFDIIFLDIDMPLLNGVEVMQNLSSSPAIIVTTAYSNFAFESYQNDVVDYLLKPISFPRFIKSIEKAKRIQKFDRKKILESLEIVINGQKSTLSIEEISYIKSFGNYVKIVLVNSKKPIIIYNSLKKILISLPNHQFLQIHKSYIINLKHIDIIEKSQVVLKDNVFIPIGRKYEILLRNYKHE